MYVRLHDGAELFYTIDDFTDPWTQPETVVLHHGMAKNRILLANLLYQQFLTTSR
jgi:hypothetical protein